MSTPEVQAPLNGIVVVSVEQAIAAPLATRQLADLGATVIKVEPRQGDLARHYDSVMSGQSVNFVWVNRGKHSVVLDIREQRDELRALIAGADVFVHNLAPDSASRAGLDVDVLSSQFPSLVVCAISGYGSPGPRSGEKAYDLAIQAEAGAFSVTGTGDMSKVGFSVADISAAMNALSGILAALFRRERTGVGGVVRVSMLESLTEWMSAPLYGAVYSGEQPPRTGRRHHSIAPYGTFDLADGSTVLLAVQTDADWRRLAVDVLGRSDLADDARFESNPDRIRHVRELEGMVADALIAVDSGILRRRLRESRIAHAGVNDLASVWSHEQLRARGRFVEVRTPSGPVEVLKSALEIDGHSGGAGAVPGLGEHDPDVVGEVRRSGAIALGQIDPNEHNDGSDDLHRGEHLS